MNLISMFLAWWPGYWFDKPDQRVRFVWEIDIDLLVSKGICYLLIDLDGTLCRWDDESVDDRLVEYLLDLRARGVIKGICVVSNTVIPGWRARQARVHRVARLIGAEAVCASWPLMKPWFYPFALGLRKLGAKAYQALMVGDQLKKDVRGAKRGGMHAVLVEGLGGEPWWIHVAKLVARV